MKWPVVNRNPCLRFVLIHPRQNLLGPLELRNRRRAGYEVGDAVLGQLHGQVRSSLLVQPPRRREHDLALGLFAYAFEKFHA